MSSLSKAGTLQIQEIDQVEANTTIERGYKDSIYSLEQALTVNPKCIESIREWIYNYHELAAMYEQRGEMLMAQKCLLIPHQSMVYMAKSKTDGEAELIAIHAINLTLPALVKFAKKHPPCSTCMNALNEQERLYLIDKTTYH